MAIYEKLLVVAVAVHCLDIDLSQRDLIEIPSNISADVTTLNLESNKIKGVNATVLMAFQELIVLKLAYNEIHYIDEEAFDNNPKLRELHLKNNRIDSMTSSFGAAHSSLKTINLWGALTQEGTRTSNFSRCVNLQILVLAHNIYPTLDVSILPHKLQVLTIKSAYLAEFPDLAHKVPSLKKLELQSNSISSIPAKRLEGLTLLNKLYIGGNPLECDCHLRDFRMLHDQGVLVVLDEPVCEGPPELHGQKLLAINISALECPTGKRNFGPYYKHGLTLMPAWLSNHMVSKSGM